MSAIPPELQVVAYGPERAEVAESFRSGYLWDEAQRTQPLLADEIARQTSCVIVRGEFLDSRSLSYLRNTVGLLTHFLDHGGVAIYDPQMFQWWSPLVWRERIFNPAAPVPRHHTLILVSEDEGGAGTEWIHTRGMRKFGRPDISFRGVTSDMREGAIDLCSRFIELQAFGGITEEGMEIRMRSLPAGLHCRHRGSLDDPDFNNVHVSIET